MSDQVTVPLAVALDESLPWAALRVMVVGLSRPEWTMRELASVLNRSLINTYHRVATLRAAGYVVDGGRGVIRFQPTRSAPTLPSLNAERP